MVVFHQWFHCFLWLTTTKTREKKRKKNMGEGGRSINKSFWVCLFLHFCSFWSCWASFYHCSLANGRKILFTKSQTMTKKNQPAVFSGRQRCGEEWGFCGSVCWREHHAPKTSGPCRRDHEVLPCAVECNQKLSSHSHSGPDKLSLEPEKEKSDQQMFKILLNYWNNHSLPPHSRYLLKKKKN